MTKKRLAIVGAGSAGLISLYYATRRLSDWEIVCFEKSRGIEGSWGNPYPGFVSTSTKYTTQFACYRKYDAATNAEQQRQSGDFFKDDEYGAYLKSFVHDHDLSSHIQHRCEVRRIQRLDERWRLTLEDSSEDSSARDEDFDAVMLCTGLAERPKKIHCDIEQLFTVDASQPVRNKKIVVVGGGESAADIANRLAAAPLGNEVWMSVETGIRVSPRYHPIRGVPSDFLRTRLLISIHEDIRNTVGQKFVEARIKYQEAFEWLFRRKTFRRKTSKGSEASSVRERRKYWAAKLTEHAKDSLFKMFHNKSDDFLDAVGENRLKIVGPPLDDSYRTYTDFEDGQPVDVDPDLLVPSIGFISNLPALADGVSPSHFYLGCLHERFDNLFLIGFARPILGNIPSINEMQAQYVTGLLAGHYPRPENVSAAHRRDRKRLKQTFPKLNTEGMYPVEMFPYCDQLARCMGIYPSLRKAGSFRHWLKIWLSPASTMQYIDENYDADFLVKQPVHSPALITVLLLLIKLFDLPYTWRANARSDP